MMNESGFSEPVIEDPNTSVGNYPWEANHGATRSYDTTNMATMTTPVTAMVAPARDASDEQSTGAGNDPEGADAGQNDAGGDADGENFGQDQGSQDGGATEVKASEGFAPRMALLWGVGIVGLGLAYMTITGAMGE
jgi:hypothetical protein